MKESGSVNSYSISINNKKYEFNCPDGEEHVKGIEKKLTSVLSAVSGESPGHVLSDYAVKVALILADDIISEKKQRDLQLNEIEEKVAPMLVELDRVIGIG